MVSILFWNVGKRPRQAQIAQLANPYDVDVILLAEVVDSPAAILSVLNRTGAEYEYSAGIGHKKISIFARFPEVNIAAFFESDRLTIRRFNPPGLEEILLAVIHFPSKRNWRDRSQATECIRVATEIRDAEDDIGHRKTILVGDFNMNPFESGFVSAIGLHAVMNRTIARTETRTVLGRKYPFFYNPMWNLLGDHTRGPAGTYFYRDSQQEVYFWNMFDQVLVRPALLDRFQKDNLAIIEHNGEQSLLNNAGQTTKPEGRLGSLANSISFKPLGVNNV